LLEALAPTVAARRDLLHRYFEPADEDERERGAKQPTAAHRAITELVGEGRIRLILTTNFDHLIE
jgi:NAD-dependent SIR2 family protein deacetylase